MTVLFIVGVCSIMVDIMPFPEFMRIPNICNNEETDSLR